MSSSTQAPDAAVARQVPAGVLERGLLLLECFTASRPRWSLRDLAPATGLDKATLLRLLKVFIGHGLLQRLEDGQYAPGPGSLRLGAVYSASFGLSERLQPVLTQLALALGETAAFYVRDGDERVCLYRDGATGGVAHHVEVGTRIRLSEGGSSAHVLLAYTGRVSPTGDQVRAQGHWITRQERLADLASVAVPVFELDGRFRGALVLIGPAQLHGDDSLRAAAQRARQLLAERGFVTQAEGLVAAR